MDCAAMSAGSSGRIVGAPPEARLGRSTSRHGFACRSRAPRSAPTGGYLPVTRERKLRLLARATGWPTLRDCLAARVEAHTVRPISEQVTE